MPDETTTSRDVIRAAIEEWESHGLPWTLYPLPDQTKADLAERIDRALFELPEDQEQALEQWAADEVAARERTRTTLAELEAEVRRLREEVHGKNETLREKNLALDALHYVWCDGGCVGGVHRYSDEAFPEEVVLQAEYQALRLRRKWNGMRWQIENWPTLPSTQTDWHRQHVERLKRKIAYMRPVPTAEESREPGR